MKESRDTPNYHNEAINHGLNIMALRIYNFRSYLLIGVWNVFEESCFLTFQMCEQVNSCCTNKY